MKKPVCETKWKTTKFSRSRAFYAKVGAVSLFIERFPSHLIFPASMVAQLNLNPYRFFFKTELSDCRSDRVCCRVHYIYYVSALCFYILLHSECRTAEHWSDQERKMMLSILLLIACLSLATAMDCSFEGKTLKNGEQVVRTYIVSP
jgi:hypothetical protein